jgi:2-amino-4-hydroxy-6-hydroxymethyldihydropteridine diphosphokinase
VAGPPGRRVAVALGSNLGDRHAILTAATERLAHLLAGIRVSTPIETKPEGPGLEDQPRYLNAAAIGETGLTSRQILSALQEIEREFGRERPYAGAPRTLDLDLILAGNDVFDEDDLIVPHPRFRSRLFVLGPLAEIGADLRDPISGLTVGEMLRALKKAERSSADKKGRKR